MTKEELEIEIKSLEEQRNKASMVFQRAIGALEFAKFMQQRLFPEEKLDG